MPNRFLTIVGEGPELRAVQIAAAGASNIELRLPVPKSELIRLMQDARAFVFAAEEDFGITMVEAQACGTPVIAFGRGGACDIIVTPEHDQPTGMLFAEQNVAAIIETVESFEAEIGAFSADACRRNSLRFSCSTFQETMCGVVNTAVKSRLTRGKAFTAQVPNPRTIPKLNQAA